MVRDSSRYWRVGKLSEYLVVLRKILQESTLGFKCAIFLDFARAF